MKWRLERKRREGLDEIVLKYTCLEGYLDERLDKGESFERR